VQRVFRTGKREKASRRLVIDVLIAGGGLVGSALAIQLGRLGISAELFERGRFPKEKPVAQRTREQGIRVSVGAKLGDIVRLILGQGRMLTVSE
jgi:glycine/D-amino acid oxidase-like deaminating enzyme